MKHKILVNGRNQNLLSDFLQHTETFFDALTTSTFWSDIVGHFRFFQPEVYIIFAEGGYEPLIQHLRAVRDGNFYNGASIVVVGDSDLCNMLERRERSIANLVIRRPVTSDNLALRITRHLEDADIAKGSQVSLTKKADQADALIKAAEAALSEAAPVGVMKKHILVVDDDRTVLKMLKSALGETYDVTTMANGSMVEKILDAKKVDLIILDYEMPVETGADIFRRIRRKPVSVNIPVCFLTGVSDRTKIMEVMSLKPHGYILKPIDMDMLSSTIKNLIG